MLLINRFLRKYYVLFNRLRLRFLKIKFGTNCLIYNHIFIDKGHDSVIEIGNNLVFTSGCGYNPLCRNIEGIMRTDANAKIIIGDRCGLSSTCIWAHKSITIGNDVKIGGDCILLDSDCHTLDWEIRSSNIINEEGQKLDQAYAKSEPIIINDHVMIGARCIILKGVSIGEGAVIGSGSVVTRSIPPFTIAAGNPCKVIRNLKYPHE